MDTTKEEYLELYDIDEDAVKQYQSMSSVEKQAWKKGYLQAVEDSYASSSEDYSAAMDYLTALDYLSKKENKDYHNPEHDPVESSKGVVGKTDPGVSGPKR